MLSQGSYRNCKCVHTDALISCPCSSQIEYLKVQPKLTDIYEKIRFAVNFFSYGFTVPGCNLTITTPVDGISYADWGCGRTRKSRILDVAAVLAHSGAAILSSD